jgi:hypothetical protein
MSTRSSTDAPWETIQNLEILNTDLEDQDPEVARNGRELYFQRDWEDIYVSTRPATNAIWGVPVELGPNINSDDSHEDAPRLTPDGLTMFFSSDRDGLEWDMDIYMSTRLDLESPWGPAVRLGPDINTSGPEFGGEIAADGYMYFNRSDGIEDWNSYELWRVPVTVVVPGDFNNNGLLDAPDINELTRQSVSGANRPAYDLNQDALVNEADIHVWVTDLFHTWIGDADLSREFNSSDLVVVLAAGTYEADTDAVWSTGDFNGDGRSNSGDLVVALADGGYELGPRAGVAAVPEPATGLLVGATLGLWVCRRRRVV